MKLFVHAESRLGSLNQFITGEFTQPIYHWWVT